MRLYAADDAGLRLTFKRCRRKSRDVGSTSGPRRRRMSSPATLPVTSSRDMLFGRRLDEPDLPLPLIQVSVLPVPLQLGRLRHGIETTPKRLPMEPEHLLMI